MASFRSDTLSGFFSRTGSRFILRPLGRLPQLDPVAFRVHDPGEAAVIVVFALQPQVLFVPLVELSGSSALKKTPPVPVPRFTPRL
jgi:hypothetical protein